MLVLLIGGIHDIRRSNGLRWHDVHTKFHGDQFKYLRNITVITATIEETVMLVLLTEEINEVSVEVVSCGIIYVQNFMKIDTGFKKILWFYLSNLKSRNVGVTDGKDL
jgi:hypothetical protein